MTLDSRNLVGAGLALAVVGLAAWGSTVLFSSSNERAGTVEVRPLIFSVEQQAQPAKSEKAQ